MRFIKAKENKKEVSVVNLETQKAISIIATKFRQEHTKYLGFNYMHSITSGNVKHRNKNANIAKTFLSNVQKYSINLDDYFKWYFTEKIKSLKSIQFYFAISKYIVSDYLLYLKQVKELRSFDKLEQGASLNNHEKSQEDYFTLHQIPRDISESKKRQIMGSFIYAANLKEDDKIVIKGQVKSLQNLSKQDLAYIKELAINNVNSFLGRIYGRQLFYTKMAPRVS